MAKRDVDKDNIELAKEHVKLAFDLINNESKKFTNTNKKEFIKELREALFALEKAESEIVDVEELDEVKNS